MPPEAPNQAMERTPDRCVFTLKMSSARSSRATRSRPASLILFSLDAEAMSLVKTARTGEYLDVVVFGLPLGRLLLWTVILAVVHRLVCVGLSLWGFFTGLGGRGAAGRSIWKLHEILDYPILLLLGKPHGYVEPFGFVQIAWSIVFGLVIAILLLSFRNRKLRERI
jgi:hypothetical protein